MLLKPRASKWGASFCSFFFFKKMGFQTLTKAAILALPLPHHRFGDPHTHQKRPTRERRRTRHASLRRAPVQVHGDLVGHAGDNRALGHAAGQTTGVKRGAGALFFCVWGGWCPIKIEGNRILTNQKEFPSHDFGLAISYLL